MGLAVAALTRGVMKIGNVAIWTGAQEAKALGCTHHARFMGIVPGFVGHIESAGPLWVPRSDLLNWLEDFLSFMGAMVCEARGANSPKLNARTIPMRRDDLPVFDLEAADAPLISPVVVVGLFGTLALLAAAVVIVVRF